MRLLIIFIFSLSYNFSVEAQGALNLSVDKVIQLCKADNLTVKNLQLRTDIAKADHLASKGWWLPEVFLGTKLHHLHGSGLNTDGRIFSDVDRQSRWYGGELGIDWDFAKGIFDTKANKLMAEAQAYRNTVNKEQQVLLAIESYYSSLLAKTKAEILIGLIEIKAKLIQQLSKQAKVGLSLESDLLLAQSNLNRLKYEAINAKQEYYQNAAQLLGLINKVKVDSLALSTDDIKRLELVNFEELEKSQIEEHPLLEAGQLLVEAGQAKEKMVNKSLAFPKAGIRYDYGPFGLDYDDNQLTRSWQGYVGWRLPLNQIFYNGEGKKADLQTKLNELAYQESKRNLQNEKNNIVEQLKLIKALLDSKGEEDFAERALEQTIVRQEAGIGTLLEVLQAQEEFIQAKLMEAEMIISYNVLQYKMLINLGRSI